MPDERHEVLRTKLLQIGLADETIENGTGVSGVAEQERDITFERLIYPN